MNKKTGFSQFNNLSFKFFKNIKSVSLVELLISMVVVATMVLSFYSLETYGHQQVINADRRAKVQNSLVYALEHMSKYVQQANGDKNSPPIQATASGFRVRVDLRDSPNQTPADLNDDVWISYSLSGNTLGTSCAPIGAGSCANFVTEPSLSSKIVANFNSTGVPATFPGNPTDGFYVSVDPSGNFVDIGLVGRWIPTQTPTAETRLTNPQVAMRTKLICNSTSIN